ncbi:MAG TPA: PEGA domain-containing protein [Polyangiaceae bacterium]|nr:PEGA domain-containing protein [Polyangiaceae bacterium]
MILFPRTVRLATPRFARATPLALAVLLAAQPVMAAPPVAAPTAASVDVRSQLPEPARKAWDAAKQLAGASDFRGALVEFQRAYELSHNPRVLFNVGVTEKLLTHYARAVDAWEKEQTEGAAQLSPSELQELKNAIAIVQQFVTTVDVTANEADATLTIDDYPVGKTPFVTPVRIDVGKHVLKLSKDGFLDSTQPIEVASGTKTPVAFKLDPVNKTALVSVTVGGTDAATVFIDGRDMGAAPFKGEVSADRHTIEARAPGFVTVGQTVDVLYKQPMSLVLTLSQERHEGRLKVSAPEGSAISIDERLVGTGSYDGVVSTTGGHQLVVTKPGYQAYSTEVFVGDDQVREVNVPLNSEVKTSWVAWGVGTILVVTGGIVAGYFVFKPSEPTPTPGTLSPFLTTASQTIRF